MTHRPEAVIDRHIVARWRELAEQRLDYLTDLRESGRWCRYYTEAGFTADIRDAEKAVAAWRLLAPPETAAQAPTADPAAARSAGNVVTWRRLPPIAFLAHDIAAERDLRQA